MNLSNDTKGDSLESLRAPAADKENVLYRGRYLEIVESDGWEFVRRVNCSAVVTVFPLTEQGEVVLVEQFRIPVQARTIEFPSGLVGDLKDTADESIAAAAGRELEEETGFRAAALLNLGESSVSPGLTNEMITYVYASGLTRVSSGGGVGDENIKVHVVPLKDIDSFLDSMRKAGNIIDRKVEGGLRFLEKQVGGAK